MLIFSFFLFDLILEFLVAKVKNGRLELDNKILAKEYLRGGFIINFASTTA